MKTFEPINKAYNEVFKPEALSMGLVVPIEQYGQRAVPTMQHHLERVQLIEDLGYKALWIRDVPFHVPSFGDAGQTFDPFTYLGYLAAQTHKIALGVASIALPLHHPVHVAKSAATVDQLSGGRLILGVASGDRPQEYPAMNIEFEARGDRFREAFHYIRKAQESFPVIESDQFGSFSGGMDILPKPFGSKIPMLMTGFSRQNLEWNAEHTDGWMYYPRVPMQQAYTIAKWRRLVAEKSTYDKPFMQPLYVILEDNDDFKPIPIQLGFRIGANHLIRYLEEVQNIGVNHVAINLRFNKGVIESTLEKIAAKVLPHFHSKKQEKTSHA